MAKLTLNIDFDCDFDFETLAVVTALSEYRLCYVINNYFGLDFERIADHAILFPKKKKENYFNMYKFYDDVQKMTYHIIANKDEQDNSLLPELKNVDYIIKLEGFSAKEVKQEFIDMLKKVPQVQAVFQPEVGDLKNKTHLLF